MSRWSMVVALTLVISTVIWRAPDRAVRAAPQSGTATIVGSVVDAGLEPLSGVSLTLERSGRVEARTTTDANGVFRFTGVAAGDYRVRAERQGLPSVMRDLRVAPGAGTIQLPIVLGRAEQERSAEAVDQAGTASSPPLPAPTVAAEPPPVMRAGRGGGADSARNANAANAAALPAPSLMAQSEAQYGHPVVPGRAPLPASRDRYARVDPNRFQRTLDEPLSTFGADVDTASYSNVRRFLSRGQLPPRDAVRIEEFVNYFRFPYAAPAGRHPIALTTEVGPCPWEPAHRLVLIGARADVPATREIEGRNLVLLLDVSGSMAPPDRLPLIRSALGMFVDTLNPDDRLAIVTYAGSSRIALPSTPVRQRARIQQAIAALGAGGSTNGGQGIVTAYRTAREAFIPGGVNRVILATDGDFNVGLVNQNDLVRLVERERDSGIFLSVLGVGTGNLNDAMMEKLADRGNGHYAYLDTLQEARRVLVREGNATLTTVARDVKFQVEFNPAEVAAWKLIGYENRALAAEDFNDDRKDAGEIGAGQTVTVLYEIVPVGVKSDAGRPGVDPLRYQERPDAQPTPVAVAAGHRGELLTVKVRYQRLESEASELITEVVRSTTSRANHLPLASAAAEFGVMLRGNVSDARRWDALEERVARLRVPATLTADKDQLEELVSIAKGLMRLR